MPAKTTTEDLPDSIFSRFCIGKQSREVSEENTSNLQSIYVRLTSYHVLSAVAYKILSAADFVLEEIERNKSAKALPDQKSK